MTLSDGFAPFYNERPSSAIVELNQLYLGYTAVAMLIGLLLVLPGVRGKNRLSFLIRWATSLFIGASIVACAQGISWHVAKVEAIMPYQADTQSMVKLEVGLKIGLATFNVTLKGNFNQSSGESTVILSEEFYFLDTDEEMDRGLKVGLPFPILNVLEHFSVKRVSSLWRWGRRYWAIGHYAQYMLWAGFAGWIFTNLLFHAVLRYGGLMLVFTGCLLIGANLSFVSISTVACHLSIQLGYYQPAILQPVFGWCFWLCLLIGILSVVLGGAIFCADHLYPKTLRKFFNQNTKEEELETCDIDNDSCSLYSRRSSECPSERGSFNFAFQNIDEEFIQPHRPNPHSRNLEEQLPCKDLTSNCGNSSDSNKQSTGKAKVVTFSDQLE